MSVRIILLVLPALLACKPGALPYALRPADTGPRFFTTQDVLFRLPGGRTERFMTTVENDGSRFSIVASSPMGQTLFILKVKDGLVATDARVPLPAEFDPRLLPILIQLSDWPLEEARRGLEAGMELREEGPTRTLLRGGKSLLTLTREGSAPPYRTTELRCPSMGLEATITTLDDAS